MSNYNKPTNDHSNFNNINVPSQKTVNYNANHSVSWTVFLSK